jgi:hypothetical protein
MIFRNISRIFPAALCCVLLFSGCNVNINPDGDAGGGTIGGVDATSYNTAGSYAIRIKNESNFDLVAFKSRLSMENILGAVPKQAGDHGLKLNTTLFPPGQSQDFSVIFLTREDYEQYKGNLSSREQYPFTRIFAAYNASGTNETPWIVSNRLGGENKLVIHNNTRWNMELRLDSPRGATLGYAPYEAYNTTLYMNQGDAFIFPVFKQYNAVRDEIITIYPKRDDKTPRGDQYAFIGGNEIVMNAADFINSDMSSGTAYLVVHNGTQQGIAVYNGSSPQKTAMGISTVNGGETRTFTILMDGSAASGYESSKSIGGWRVVHLGTDSVDIPAASLEADYRYTVEVSGSWSEGAGGVTVSSPVKGADKVTADFGDTF